MRTLLHTIIIFNLMFLSPPLSLGDIYKYRDTNGRLIFVDDPGKIPPQLRDNITTLPEAKNSPVIDYNFDTDVELSDKAGVLQKKVDDIASRKKQRKHQTPVIISDNRVLVPVEVSLGNRTAKLSLLLDTGATSTVFHRESLNELDLPNGKRYKARVAGGGIVKSERIKFRQITVGPFQQKKTFAMVINVKGKDLAFDGMLGMDFLKSHPYQIDFKNRVITWEPLD